MKKLALALAVIAAPFAAQAEAEKPKFYGKLNVSYQTAEESGKDSVTEVKSNASRLGVKGKIALDNNLQGIYKVEYEIFPDQGEFQDSKDATDELAIKQRNTYAGIKSSYGEVIVGKFDTPLKKVQKKVDLFNDLEGDIKNTITKNDNRESNSVQYTSPKINGFQAKIDRVESEDSNVDGGTSLSVTYSQNGIYVGYAFDKDVEGEEIEVSRLAAQYNAGALQLGALYEDQDDNGESTDGFLVSAAYKLGKTKLKAQYGESDVKDADSETLSIGADYKLAKKAKVFAYYTDNTNGDSSTEYLGVGLEYKF